LAVFAKNPYCGFNVLRRFHFITEIAPLCVIIKIMNHDQFLKLFQKTLFDLSYLDTLKTIDNVQVVSADLDNSIWWNNASIAQPPNDETIAKVEDYFRFINRPPVFYFVESPNSQPFEQLLASSGYHQDSYEVWMQIKNPQINTTKFSQIKKVETTEDLEIFIRTIDQGYGADDPDNPYGESGPYLDQIRKSFNLHGPRDIISYYILFDEHAQPVSVGSLTNYHHIGYISNLATIPSQRGRGNSYALLNYFLHLSLENHNHLHCLSTEVDSHPHRIYQRFGFTEMFRAKYYSKTP